MKKANTVIVLFAGYHAADAAAKNLNVGGFEMWNLSVVGKGFHTEDKVGDCDKPQSMCLLGGLIAAVAIGVVTMIGSTGPSMAEVASTKFGMVGHTLIDNVAWQGHRGAGGGRIGAGRIGGGRFGGFRGGYAGRRGYGYRGGGGVAAAGVAGVAAGAIVRSALAGQAYPGYGYQANPAYGYQDAPDPGYGYGYAQPVATYAVGESAAYCESHFRSFNPVTGTYLGFDGLEHPCP
jgi:hypothetical protein